MESDTHKPSLCGKTLDISLSSIGLEWDGVILEQGYSPYFHPKDVVTPYFYFALGQEQDLHWNVVRGEEETRLITHPGHIWFNPPYTAFTHNVDEPCYFIILAVDQMKMFDAVNVRIDPDTVDLLNNYNIEDPMLKGLIDLFYLEAKSGGRNGEEFIENLTVTLAEYFFANYSNLKEVLHTGRKASARSSLSLEDLKKIDKYFEQHLGDSISLDAPASLVNMSLFHFLREFKKSRNITPYQYLLRMKIDKAKELLRDRDLTLAHIAMDLGFSDQSHFSRTFRRATGLSPGQFRVS